MESDERLVSAAEVTAIHTRLRAGGDASETRARHAFGTPSMASYEVYDWTRPRKLKGDQIRTLTSIHETLCRILASSLGAYLRIPVECALSEDGVVASSYGEYQDVAPEGNLYHIVYAPPFAVPWVVELEEGLSLAILDRLLGGLGRGLTREHEITDIEQVLLQERVVTHVLEAFREAWSDIADLTPIVNQTETNISYVPIVLPSDVVVIVTATLHVGEASGLLRLCLPFGALEPFKDQLIPHALAEEGERPQEVADQVRRQVDNVSLTLVVRLGEALVTLDDLLQLQVGDVIPLDTLVDGEIDVLVGGRPRYRGRPGLLRSRNAVRVTRIIEEEELIANGRHGERD